MVKNYELEQSIQLDRFRDTSLRDRFDAVFIDVDSCLCAIEGIDELARIYGKYEQVALLTTQAMNGEVPFEAVFGKRLEMIRPAQKDLDAVAGLYIATRTPFAKEVIRLAQQYGVNVYILSAGYHSALLPLARTLGIADSRVLANTLFFDQNGQYVGYDEKNPLTQRGGKLTVIEKLQREGIIKGKIAIVGDSVSELEAKPAVDIHVGFGGWKERPRIPEKSDMYIKNASFAALAPIFLGSRLTKEILDYNPELRAQTGHAIQQLGAVRVNDDDIQIEVEAMRKTIPAGTLQFAYPVKPVSLGY